MGQSQCRGTEEAEWGQASSLTSALGWPARLTGPPWQCCCPHHVPVNASVKDLLSLSPYPYLLSLSSSSFIPLLCPPAMCAFWQLRHWQQFYRSPSQKPCCPCPLPQVEVHPHPQMPSFPCTAARDMAIFCLCQSFSVHRGFSLTPADFHFQAIKRDSNQH